MGLSSDQRWTLLLIARRSIEAAVCGREIPDSITRDPGLDHASAGVFVTVKTHHQLRGCIGRLVGDQPLAKLVSAMAAAAATEDLRFSGQHLLPHELCDCHIEISIISPLELIKNPVDFEIGRHGIYVRSGIQTGCFLPQVGPEYGWTPEEMLSQCCMRKAGMDPGAWRRGEVEVFRFTAEIIEEPQFQAAHPNLPGQLTV